MTEKPIGDFSELAKFLSWKSPEDRLYYQELIGTGRFGTVFTETQPANLPLMAVKKYSPAFYDFMPTDATNIKSKMHQLFYIRHPFLVWVIRVWKSECGMCIMELAESNVHDDVVNNGRYNELKAKHVIWQVIEALEFLQSKQIVHGSLHTRNLLVFKGGVVKVSDVATGAMLDLVKFGNDVFLAPELRNGQRRVNGSRPLTFESDMWALGVSLYFMTTETIPEERQWKLYLILESTISPHLQDIFDNIFRTLPGERLPLQDLKSHGWFGKGDEVPKLPFVDFVDDLKTVPYPQKGELTRFVLLPEITPKRIFKKFAVLVVEDGQLGAGEKRIEKCKFRLGMKRGVCLRITIPTENAKSSKTAFNGIANYFNVEKSEKTMITDIETILEEAPKSDFFKVERRYFGKEESEKIWKDLDLKICRKCKRADTDSLKHNNDMCLYKMVAETTECNEEIIFCKEDQYNLRFYNLVYRTDGGHVGPLTRLKRRAARILSSGYQSLLHKVCGQESLEED